MTTTIKNLNKKLEANDNLKLDLDSLEIQPDLDDEFEKTLTAHKRQLINKLLTYYGYEPIFNIPNQSNQEVICKHLYNFAQDTIEDLNLDHGNSEIAFRTDDHGDQRINDLTNYKGVITGMYVILEAPNNSTVTAEITINPFNETTESLAKYLTQMTNKLYREMENALISFDANEEFNELWSRDLKFSPREFLAMLDEDQEFFMNIINKPSK